VSKRNKRKKEKGKQPVYVGGSREEKKGNYQGQELRKKKIGALEKEIPGVGKYSKQEWTTVDVGRQQWKGH